MTGVYQRVVDDLNLSADAKFKEFNDKIVKTAKPTIGVRTPDIKKIAKSLTLDEASEYLKTCRFDYLEDTLVFGFLVAKTPFDEFWKLKDEYLSKVDSWAEVDSFVSAIKLKKKDAEKLYDRVMKNVDGSQGFFLRFYLVCLMRFFLDDERVEEIFKVLENVDGRGYYCDMASAWLLSVAFVKDPEKTEVFLKDGKLSDFTRNKAISKIRDSYRVSAESKKQVKTYARTKSE